MAIMFDSKEHRSLVAQCWIAVYAASLASSTHLESMKHAEEADVAIDFFVERFKDSKE